MEKLASQMLEKAKQFVASNPQIVKNTLLAGGLGAAAGAMIPSPAEDEDEPASARLKRRLKNALIGGTVAGGAGALLSNAAYNFGTAKLQRQLTPEEKFIEAQDDLAGTLKNPLTLLGGAAVGGGIGATKDWKVQQGKANAIIKRLNDSDKTLGLAEGGTAGLRDWLYAHNPAASGKVGALDPSALKAFSRAKGVDKAGTGTATPEIRKALRELNISARKAGALVGGSVASNLTRKERALIKLQEDILPRLKGNWRTAGLAAAVPLGLGITGAMVDPD